MNIKHVSEGWLKDEIRKIVGKHLDNSYRAFFFGSRVKGNNSERADIDLGIKGSKKIPIEKKFAILDDLDEIPTLYKFDLVDFQTTEKSFAKEALKYTEEI